MFTKNATKVISVVWIVCGILAISGGGADCLWPAGILTLVLMNNGTD
jgi:hypothetical protein